MLNEELAVVERVHGLASVGADPAVFAGLQAAAELGQQVEGKNPQEAAVLDDRVGALGDGQAEAGAEACRGMQQAVLVQ